MGIIENISNLLPEVEAPTQKRLPFKEKIKWTLIILVSFYILGHIPLFGLGQNALTQFEYLSIILGASFGSIISLGIGPIVTGSIVLQLLNGSGILKFDLTTPEGKNKYQSLQKLMSIFFVIFESCIYVFMGGLAPPEALAGTSAYFSLEIFLVLQLILGGYMIILMDEVCSKWGLGSGLSLFIAAGVSQEIFLKALNPFPSLTNPEVSAGAIPAIFQFLATNDPRQAFLLLSAILATIFVFIISVYGQAMKVEIPLSYGRVRGQGVRWPLNFIYTSNIPVILIAALMANIQLWARLLQNWGNPWLGTFVGNTPATGFIAWIHPPNLLERIMTGSLVPLDVAHSITYLLFMIGGAVLFSYFWVQTSGMDARSQAKQISAYGLQIPGFRNDQRVLERLLDRYIQPLTIMGAILVGFLAASADLLGALARGTGILLAVMIIYKMYEEIAKQHMMDMNPGMRKFMGGK
ncbi:preprotein translocase subunit SecY [Candidatus Woesearchaeota archaeon]|nr:preprotein translocase subunit SecY [Candidatus Woesearchaeota archaeon]